MGSEAVSLGGWIQVLQGIAVPSFRILVLLDSERETATSVRNVGKR